jgi:glycosyltransferase involved in cell wall biosynthesis
MNILLINHYAGSPIYGMEFRPFYLAKYWQLSGHRVKIIAASFSHLRTNNPKVTSTITEEHHDGVNYTWVKTPAYRGNGIRRVVNIFAFLFRLLLNSKKVVFNFKPDLIITSSTYPLDSFLGVLCKRRSKCVYLHEVHDLWPLTLTEIGGFNSYHPFIILLQIAENYAYKNSDAVVSMLPNAKSYMIKHKLKERNFYHIPNGYFQDEWVDYTEIPNEHKDTLSRLKKENKLIVMYAGGHALSNALEQLIECANELQLRDDICFVLVGSGIEKENLMAKAQQFSLQNTYFLPQVPKSNIPFLLSFADILFIGWHYSPLYEYGISPNKLIDYMLSGKPIVHAISVSDDIVKICGCGFSVKSGDLIEIKNAFLAIADMTKEERAEMGNRGKVYAQDNYNYRVLANNFINIFTKYKK